jgi:excisionase family DNA binding protein
VRRKPRRTVKVTTEKKTQRPYTPLPLVPVGDESGRMLTLADLVHRWNVRKSWVYSRVASGDLPCVRLGKYLRFRQADLDNYLAQEHQRSA